MQFNLKRKKKHAVKAAVKKWSVEVRHKEVIVEQFFFIGVLL